MLTGVFAYDPSEITLSLGGWQPYGFAEGTKIVVAKANDLITPYSGTDGDVSLALNRNRLGTMTISLQRTSDANAILTNMALQMYTTREVAFPVYMKDPRGNYIETIGWIQGQPQDTMGDTIQGNDWVIGLKDASLKRDATSAVLSAIGTAASLIQLLLAPCNGELSLEE